MEIEYGCLGELREQLSKRGLIRENTRERRGNLWDVKARGPVVFVGQPEYYRDAYYDAVSDGKHFEYPIRFTKRSPLEGLPKFVEERGIGTCVIFRPEFFFGAFSDVFFKLKKMEVCMVGFSTEPLPFRWDEAIHPDKRIRLNSLLDVLNLDYDLIVHYDASSLDILKKLGFGKVIANPIPVSRKLYFPEDCEPSFDICFLGRSTEYRESVMARLKCELDIVHIVHGITGHEARRIINRSKAVLNIHNYEYDNYEHRVTVGLFCRKVIFSERLSGGLLMPERDYILYESGQELYEKFMEFLRGTYGREPEIDLSIFTVERLLERIGIEAEIR